MLTSFILNFAKYFAFSIPFIGVHTAFFSETIYNDMPEPWLIGFQDGVSPGYTGIIELHNNIFFYLVVIAILVFWMLGSTIYYFNYDKTKITHKYLVHGTLIEILWTIFPAIVLLAIAIPSFRLLYILDEVTLPTITVKVTGFLTDGPKSYIINKIKNTKIYLSLVCSSLKGKNLKHYARWFGQKSFIYLHFINLLLQLPSEGAKQPSPYGKDAAYGIKGSSITMHTSFKSLAPYFWMGSNKLTAESNGALIKVKEFSNVSGIECRETLKSNSLKKALNVFNMNTSHCTPDFALKGKGYVLKVSKTLSINVAPGYPGARAFHSRTRAINRIGPHELDVISVIFGLLLGDGYANNRSGEGVRIAVKQSIIHKEYLLFLYNFFFDRGYCTNLKPREYKRTIKGRDKIYLGYEFNTYTFRSFLWIYDSFYKKGKKILPLNIEKHLNELTLSIWIMDDGGWTGEGVRISANSFTYEELKRIIIIMKDKFDLDCTIQKIKIKDRYSIYIKKNSIIKLRAITNRHIHKSMTYKLGL